jgi:hypothetical protein
MKHYSIFFILLTTVCSNAYAGSNEADQAAQTKSWVAAYMADDPASDSEKLNDLRGYYSRHCTNEEADLRLQSLNKSTFLRPIHKYLNSKEERTCAEIRALVIEAERKRPYLSL